MIRCRIAALAVVAVFPACAFAQVKPSVAISAPTAQSVIKSIKLSDIAGTQGTVVTGTTAIGGMICCWLAKSATGGAGPSLVIHFGDGSVHSPALQTGISIAHDAPHSLTVSLNGADIFGVQCDAKGSLKATPNFAALGASTGGYKWELRENGKTVKAGVVSNGSDGIVIDEGGHTATEMSFGITDHGVMTLYHGAHTLIIVPVAMDIGAKAGGYVHFDDLGLRVAGASEFSVLSPALVSGLQPPGSRQ